MTGSQKKQTLYHIIFHCFWTLNYLNLSLCKIINTWDNKRLHSKKCTEAECIEWVGIYILNKRKCFLLFYRPYRGDASLTDWAQVKGIFREKGFWEAFAFFCFLKGGCYVRGLQINRGFGSGKNRRLQKLWLRKNWLVLGTWMLSNPNCSALFLHQLTGWDETKQSITMKVTCLTLLFHVMRKTEDKMTSMSYQRWYQGKGDSIPLWQGKVNISLLANICQWGNNKPMGICFHIGKANPGCSLKFSEVVFATQKKLNFHL